MRKDNRLAGLLPFITEQLASLNPRNLPPAIHPLKILRHWWCQTRLIRRLLNRPIYHTQFRCLPLRLNRRN